MRFDGKGILITGATSGIGAAAARRFGAAGGRVVVSGRHQMRGAAMAAEIEDAGGEAHFIAADLTDSAACEGLVAAAAERLGGLDVLVNAAGIIHRKDAAETSDAEWRETMAINLDAVFYLSRAAVRLMKPRGGGVIVNVAS
ncbi:MAG: SDR family NAD(P)-dependent oxidoreductase, partial [Paracoccaceae bacterium]